MNGTAIAANGGVASASIDWVLTTIAANGGVTLARTDWGVVG